MTHPRVSIGMPVYNGANFIRAAIASLLSQEFGDFELIISDNASTDDTEAICRDLAQMEPRIRYSRNTVNLGASKNYNKVFHLAHGEFFKWAAHDDECHPAMLRRCVEELGQAPDSVAMVYPLAVHINARGETIPVKSDRIASSDSRPHRRLARVLWGLNYCDPVFGLLKTSFLEKTQLIGPFFGADYVLLGELAMLGRIQEIPESLFRLRAHEKRSMKANPGTRARSAWFDPLSTQRRFVMPGWERMVWELMKSARRAPLPPGEKLCCEAVIPAVHYWRRFRNFGGRMKARGRTWLGPPGGDRPSPAGKESGS